VLNINRGSHSNEADLIKIFTVSVVGGRVAAFFAYQLR
jgi:hypothetical protein